MNRSLLKRMALWAGVAALSGTLALAQEAAQAGAARTDGQIEMDVVHALDASAALKADLITAATIQGRVTLSGTVSSEDSKRLAETIVKGVAGVSGVDNNLKVGNPANDPNAISGNPADDATDQMAQGGQPDQDQQQPYADRQPQYADNGQQGQQPQYGDNSQQQANQQPQYAQAPPYPQQPQGVPQPSTPPPPPGYGYGYGNGQRPGYQQAPPPGPAYQYATRPVTVPAGTLLQVRTNEPVESKHAQEGQPVQFTVIQDVTFGGVLAIPRGATVHGVLTGVKNVGSGTLTGSSELALQLTSMDLGGQSYPLATDQFRVKSPGKGGRSAGNIIAGTLLGAVIGGAAGGGGGAAIGAVAGGTVGTAASAASHGPAAWIPAEALVSFHLVQPVTVNPVGQQEAMRLAQGLYPGGPTLYRRSYYGGPYGRPAPYPYYYAPVYYRPYYAVGGAYYWR